MLVQCAVYNLYGWPLERESTAVFSAAYKFVFSGGEGVVKSTSSNKTDNLAVAISYVSHISRNRH